MELTIEQALQEGIAAHMKGKLQDAERFYRAILQSQPAHPDANHNLGIIAVSNNKTDIALPLFETALEANPKIEQFWLSYIDALTKENQFDNARQILEQAKKHGVAEDKLNALEQQLALAVQALDSTLSQQNRNLTFSEKRKELAKQKKRKKKTTKQNLRTNNPPQQQLSSLLEYYQKGRYSEAEKLSVQITQEFPDHQFAWKVLGAVLGATGRKSEAVDANQIAVALSPKDAAAHSNLGVALKELGRLDEAEASYNQAIALKPDYAEAHGNLGNTLKELGRLDEALANYNQAVALKPNYAEAHSNLGNTLKELGRLDEAEASYNQAIALKPDYAEAHSNLGNTLKELGRLDEAKASYNQAIALKPDYAEAHYNLGIFLKELDTLGEAVASYDQAIALKPEYAEAHSNLGNTLYELGRLDEAKASYNQAIALKPGYAEAHSNLGNTLKDLGRLDEAKASYNQAIALKPDYAEAHYNLGIFFKELDRLDEAESSLRQAITLKPNYAKAHDHLGVVLQSLSKFEEAEVCYKTYISLISSGPFEEPLTKSMASKFFNQGEFKKALDLFDGYNTPDTRSSALDCLYALGNIKEIYTRIEDTAGLDDGNLRVAAFASFIAEYQQKETAHRFCKKPLEFIYTSNISANMKEPNSFITNLIEDLRNIKATWDPPNQSAMGGFQTAGNLFRYSNRNIATLKEIIFNEIDTYYEKFKNEHCSFIEKWPAEKNIKGWHIILKEQGYHNFHIHQDGWLSGVIYLKVVPSLNKNEGAITFNLANSNKLYPDFPKIIHNPEVGDILLFPSSLYHGTIPFSTETERIVVSFDLMPGNSISAIN